MLTLWDVLQTLVCQAFIFTPSTAVCSEQADFIWLDLLGHLYSVFCERGPFSPLGHTVLHLCSLQNGARGGTFPGEMAGADLYHLLWTGIFFQNILRDACW